MIGLYACLVPSKLGYIIYFIILDNENRIIFIFDLLTEAFFFMPTVTALLGKALEQLPIAWHKLIWQLNPYILFLGHAVILKIGKRKKFFFSGY